MSHACYLSEVFNSDRIKSVARCLVRKFPPSDWVYVVSGGISGTVLAGLLISKGHKVSIVRKKRDGTHSSFKIESTGYHWRFGYKFVFVNDLISFGKTFMYCSRMLCKEYHAEFSGVFTYAHEDDDLPSKVVDYLIKQDAIAYDMVLGKYDVVKRKYKNV